MSNGVSFAEPNADSGIYLIRACGQSPSATGLVAGSAWSGDDLFLSMDRSPDLTQRFRDTKGIGWRRISGLSQPRCPLSGLPVTDLHSPCSQLLSLCVGWASARSALHLHLVAAYASVKKQDLPMATTSLNIVWQRSRRADSDYPLRQRFWDGGWGWHSPVLKPLLGAFTAAFVLLCGLHALLFAAAMRLPFSSSTKQWNNPLPRRNRLPFWNLCPSDCPLPSRQYEAITLQTNASMRCPKLNYSKARYKRSTKR